MRIEKKILRIARRRQHTAKVGRQRLQNDDALHVQLQRFADDECQRHKGQKRYVVRHEHRADIGDAYERQRQLASAYAAVQKLHRHIIKKAHLLESGHHQHQRQQHAQHIKINIGQPRRLKKAARAGQKNRQTEDGLPAQELFYLQ